MPPTDSINILILGAGELGQSILNALLSHPRLSTPPRANPTPKLSISVRAETLARTPPPAHVSALLKQPVTLRPLDPVTLTPEDLAKALAPYDTVITCLGYVAPPTMKLQLKIATAVLAANVKRYIPWQFGLDYDVIGYGSPQPLFDEQLDVRALLRGQKRTEWVIMQTGVFISFLFEEWWGVVSQSGSSNSNAEAGLQGNGEIVVRALGAWDVLNSVTAAPDIGRCVAALLFDARPVGYSASLSEWERYASGKVNVAGDTVTYAQLADIVEKVAAEKGKKVRREVWNVDRLKEELAASPDDTVRRYRATFAQGKGTGWDKLATLNGGRGMEMVSVEEWARKVIM